MKNLRRAPATAAILAVIAIVFVYEVITGATNDNQMLFQLGAIMPWSYIAGSGEYWRLITGMFLHANVLHWATNTWSLYQLGTLYEAMFGSKRFVLTYFVTGLCASLASSLARPSGGISLGASGAVLGILGAFIFSIRRSPQFRHEPWTRGLIYQLIFWGVLNVALGFEIPQIDNVAHIAGIGSGLLLGFILPHRVPPPPPSYGVIDVKPYEEALDPRSQNQP